MYYLAKFCRICIQSGGNLLDIESTDYDSIKLSEKLQICTDMIITRESLSTQICSSCIQKLRISYQFRSMCSKSTSVLQRYLTELLSVTDTVTADKFINSELRVTVSKTLPKARRKRVGKDERCSLLKKLLSKITEEQMMHNIHINGLTKLCDKLPIPAHKPTRPKQVYVEKKQGCSGGLRDILNFTKGYDFGYCLDKSMVPHENFDLTSIDKLTKFTENFFYDHFGDYRDSILYVGDNINFDSDSEDEMFTELDTRRSTNYGKAVTEQAFTIKREVVIVEPSNKIKTEMELESEYKPEMLYDDDAFDYDISSNFVQACYESDDDQIKQESGEIPDVTCSNFQSNYSFNNYAKDNVSYVGHNDRLAEIIPLSPSLSSDNQPYSLLEKRLSSQNLRIFNHLSNNSVEINSVMPHSFIENYPSNSNLIAQLQAPPLDLSRKPRTLSPHSTRCRTRGNPFINPQLKKQFQMRNFKCCSCNRRFKSPGYLKAHCSKLGH